MKVTIEDGDRIVDFEADYVVLGAVTENGDKGYDYVEGGLTTYKQRIEIAAMISAQILGSTARDMNKKRESGITHEEYESFKRDLENPSALQDLIRKFQSERGGAA